MRSHANPATRTLWPVAAMFTLVLLLGLAADAPSSPAGGAPVTAPAVPAFRQASVIAILPVTGVIDAVTHLSLTRRIEAAQKAGAQAIVIELNTPGGEMEACLNIRTLLSDRALTPANTVAWINPQAYSAGVLIALACREIVASSNAAMGDAAPIQGIPMVGMIPMPVDERAKTESVLLAEVVKSARSHHYDEKLVQAFVSAGIEIWMIQNTVTGERAFVDREEYKTLFGQEPPTQLGAIAPSGGTLRPWYNTQIPEADAARAMTEAERTLYIEQQQSRPSVRQTFTEADRGQWKLLFQIDSADRLLTINQDEAIFYGLANRIVNHEQDLKAFFGATQVLRFDQNWSESLVRFLTSFWVRGLLLAIFLICLFVEMATPGVGVFGAGAVVALLVLIGAPALIGMAQWWEILLIVLGLLLVAAELFVIPGTGIAGVAGAVCLLVGIVGTFISDDLSSSQGQRELLQGVGTTIVSLIGAGAAIWFLSRHIQSLPLFERLILRTELKPDDGPATGGAGLIQAMAASQRALRAGDTGVAETDLRPAGRASLGGRLVDVMTAGDYIDRGTPIRVVSVGRFSIEVERA